MKYIIEKYIDPIDNKIYYTISWRSHESLQWNKMSLCRYETFEDAMQLIDCIKKDYHEHKLRTVYEYDSNTNEEQMYLER